MAMTTMPSTWFCEPQHACHDSVLSVVQDCMQMAGRDSRWSALHSWATQSTCATASSVRSRYAALLLESVIWRAVSLRMPSAMAVVC
jgi:hypothetical protein